MYLPGLAQLQVSLPENRVQGCLTPAVLDSYGVFEDLNALGLAPLLRRRGRAFIHGFAASSHDRALLLVGDNASGKTTTGLALLAAGWKLIANDSPLLGEQKGRIVAFAYPGFLSVPADALKRIPALQPMLDAAPPPRRPGWKTTFAAEDWFPSPWQMSAPVGAGCLLRLKPGATEHRLGRLSPAEALGRLLPHSADRWDQEMLPFQIDLLQRLAGQAPIYRLDLGPQVPALPGLLEKLVVS